MKVLPTFYIHHGQAVSALEGSSVHTDALDQAASLSEQHVRFAIIDIDAARGSGHNRELIGQLIRRLRQSRNKVFIQVGGGIRSSDLAQHFLDQGVTWLLLGTAFHRNSVMLDLLMARFQAHLMAALDVRQGVAMASGWSQALEPGIDALVQKAQDLGFRRILLTDVPTSEANGPDFATAQRVGQTTKLPVFLAGYVRTPEHMLQAASVPCLHGILLDALAVDSLGEPALMAVSQDA